LFFLFYVQESLLDEKKLARSLAKKTAIRHLILEEQEKAILTGSYCNEAFPIWKDLKEAQNGPTAWEAQSERISQSAQHRADRQKGEEKTEGIEIAFEKFSKELEVGPPASLCRNKKRNPSWVNAVPQVFRLGSECSFVPWDKNLQQGSWLEEHRVEGNLALMPTRLGSLVQGTTYIIPHSRPDCKLSPLSLINIFPI
jgi:hypothetical protein